MNGQRPEEIPSYNPLTGESSGGSKKNGYGITKPLKAESDPRMKRLIRVLQTFISLTDDEKRKIKGESTTLTVLQKLIKASKDAPARQISDQLIPLCTKRSRMVVMVVLVHSLN